MASFDVVSEFDQQEVRNAVDQVSREVSTRFDFKGAGAEVELGKDGMTLRASTEDRLKALRTVVEEKFVRRKLSLKALGLKGVQSSGQGDSLRVTSKKRDDLQAVQAALREADLDYPLQFTNRRD